MLLLQYVITVIFFIHVFFNSSYNSAVSGAETFVREQPGNAEETWCQTDPEAWPHLSEATPGYLEVRHNAMQLYRILYLK